MSASAFTQSPRTSFESVYFDDDIHVAASTCKGVENQVADIMAFLIKELRCAAFPERHRSPVQEPLRGWRRGSGRLVDRWQLSFVVVGRRGEASCLCFPCPSLYI